MMPRTLGGEDILPEALGMMRMLGGALFFQVFVRARARPAVAIVRRDHARLVGLSFLGISINQTLFLMGLRWSSPFSVALLTATIPVLAAGLSVLFGQEHFSWRTMTGLVLAFAGVASLVGVQAGGALDPGSVLVALNSFSYAAYVVLSREIVRRLGALRTVAWVFTYGALAFAPLGMPPLLAQLPSLTLRGWALSAYIVLVPTLCAYLINAWALGRSSATLVTLYIYLQPLLAAVLAWWQLGHGISRSAGLAALLILTGLAIVVSRKLPTSDSSARA